jgi:two-component system, NtrC family, sensor kinase
MKTKEEVDALTARISCLEELMSVQDDVVAEQSARLRKERDRLMVAEENARKSLEELRATQQRLMAASRQAGMAEIAISVLHNVGNVLNSVNVSAALIQHKLRTSRTPDLLKITGLMKANDGDLAAYMTTDRRGKLLPAYLSGLAERLVAEQHDLANELTSLTNSVEHIKQIVNAHHSYARPFSMAETLDPVDLIEDSLRIGTEDLGKDGIHIERQYGNVDAIVVDKHKLLQILVNLVKNARAALAASDRVPRILAVSAHRDPEDESRVLIQVKDNGVGIKPENMARIFEHGFTTKATGNGFGLHGSALAATALGGSLGVHSDGAGTGAAFTLRIPMRMGANSAQKRSAEDKAA